MLNIKFGAPAAEDLEDFADAFIDATVGAFDPIYLPRTASPTRVQQAQRAATTTRQLATGTVYTITTPTTYPTRTTDWTKDPKPHTAPDV